MLRANLIQLAEVWDDVGFVGQCPIRFSEEEIKKHNEQFQRYRDIKSTKGIARKLFDTDSEGWRSPQLDFALKVRQNKELLEGAMRRSSEYNMSPEEVSRIWPF